MKPFLLLAIRAEDAAADNEYDSFLSLSGLGEGGLRRVRLEQRALGSVDLDDWSGILVGGGPFNYSDPEELKTPVQRRVEADLAGLYTRIGVYKHAGYFDPDEADEIKARAARSDVTWPPAILRGFVRRYGQRVPARAQAG